MMYSPLFKMAKNAARRQQRQAGFTLIEFAIVITIGALVMTAALELYADHLKKQKIETTYQRIFEANALMAGAMNVANRYYCPADPNLAVSDANYGLEDCAIGTSVGNCTGGGTNGVCVGAGVASGLVNDNVLIGMFPFKSFIKAFDAEYALTEKRYNEALANAETSPESKENLRRALISMRSAKPTTAANLVLDGWNNQLTYMVSRALTDAETFKKTSGSVQVMMDEANLDTATSKGVHFALISHGENGNGARRRNGSRRTPCDASLPEAERENCDIDGRIVRPNSNSLAVDDVVVYNVHTADILWEKVACDLDGNAANGEEGFCLVNKNAGNVAVAHTSGAIEQKLTVGGHMRAEDVETDQVCDPSGDNCFSPSLIAGVAMNRCPEHPSPEKRYVAEKISENRITCREVTMPVYGKSCPDVAAGPAHGKRLIKGYDINGDPVCVDPCEEDTQYRVQDCPGAGMTGQIFLQSHYSCSSRTWSAWGEWQPDTCAVACVSGFERSSVQCPAGYSGTITMRRDRTCPGAYGAWYEESNTCTEPTPGCQTFNLTLYSNCDPAFSPVNSVESCPGGEYAMNNAASATYNTCGANSSGHTMPEAKAAAIDANCEPLATGQVYATSGCP